MDNNTQIPILKKLQFYVLINVIVNCIFETPFIEYVTHIFLYQETCLPPRDNDPKEKDEQDC